MQNLDWSSLIGVLAVGGGCVYFWYGLDTPM